MNEPKYQLSRFLDGNRNEQVVIRSDELDEFTRMIGEVDTLFTKGASQGKPQPVEDAAHEVRVQTLRDYKPVEQPMAEVLDEEVSDEKREDWCNLHREPMKRREIPGGNGFFYDHRRSPQDPRNTDGVWLKCNGVSGFKPDKPRR